MSILLDIIVLAIIIIMIVISARKGFVQTVVGVVGFFVAVLLAFTVAEPLANLTYDIFVENSMVSAAEESADDLTDDVWKSLPDYVKDNAETLGISKSEVNKVIDENAQKGSETAVKKVSDALIKPAATKIIGGLLSFVLFIIFMVVIKFVAKFLNKLFSFSVIGKVNTILGGGVGLIKGSLYALIFVTVTALLASVNQGSFLIFSDEAIGESTLYRLFAELASIYPFK